MAKLNRTGSRTEDKWFWAQTGPCMLLIVHAGALASAPKNLLATDWLIHYRICPSPSRSVHRDQILPLPAQVLVLQHHLLLRELGLHRGESVWGCVEPFQPNFRSLFYARQKVIIIIIIAGIEPVRHSATVTRNRIPSAALPASSFPFTPFSHSFTRR